MEDVWRFRSVNPSSGGSHVMWGGSFFDAQSFARCAFRLHYIPYCRVRYRGLRVAVAPFSPTSCPLILCTRVLWKFVRKRGIPKRDVPFWLPSSDIGGYSLRSHPELSRTAQRRIFPCFPPSALERSWRAGVDFGVFSAKIIAYNCYSKTAKPPLSPLLPPVHLRRLPQRIRFEVQILLNRQPPRKSDLLQLGRRK